MGRTIQRRTISVSVSNDKYEIEASAYRRLPEIAKSKGIDIIAAFRNGYKNVGVFEQQYSVKLPEDIAAMLTQG